ncbi:MAG: redoxin family protein [Terriglobia bacterium]|jgi:thiol-disulfide isomerase/thioredoxin
MKAGNITRLPLYLPFILGVCLLGTIGRLPLRGAQVVTKPAEEAPATPAAPDAEQSALDDAFRSAQGNPQLLIKNFEAFLVRFPQSSRREAVLRTICTYAQEANAPDVVVQYGQMLLERTPNDPHLLTLLMDALARQNDQASRTRAIEYSSRLIAIAESQRDQAVAAAGSSNAADQWAERLAGIYARRAGFYRDSDEVDKAVADCEKSYAIYPTSRVAEQLGDAALKKGNSARALDYYLTAFVFPDKSPEPGSRQEIRRKLGSLYVAQHHSEHGLGDLVLSHYDAIMPQLAGRLSASPLPNAGRHDPFEYVLERMDGTPLPLAGYRGKVLVLDFWATWCGPCRVQGKLVEQVAGSFRTDSTATFLSLNTDQDRSGVPAFLKNQGWTLPVAYAQGLDELLSVRALPTLVIFDCHGRVVFREDGVDPGSFVEEVSRHLRETLRELSPGPMPPS